MVTQEITDGQTAAPYEITGTESPSTLKKLVNPLEVGGEGHNAPKQISNALTLNDSIESNFYSGHISSQRQYAVKLLFSKEFERQKMLQKRLDPKMYKLYFVTLSPFFLSFQAFGIGCNLDTIFFMRALAIFLA